MTKAKHPVKFDRPPILPIFVRVFYLCFALVGAMIAAFSWFSLGLSWVYDFDRDYSPLLSCPDFILNDFGGYPDGPTCRMSLRYSYDLLVSIGNAGLLLAAPDSQYLGMCSVDSASSPEYFFCYWGTPCGNVCTPFGSTGRCPNPATLLNPANVLNPSLLPQCSVRIGSLAPITMPCFDVSVDSYCDDVFRVTPSNEIAIRGIVVASIAILVIWTIAEFVLRGVEVSIKKEVAEGRAEQQLTLASKIKELRQVVEKHWEREERDDDRSVCSFAVSVRSADPVVAPSPLARQTMPRFQYIAQSPMGSGSPSGASTPRAGAPRSTFSSPLNSGSFSRNKDELLSGAARFSSAQWKRRMRRYHVLRTDKQTSFKTRDFGRSLALSFAFFSILVVTLYVVLRVSPQHITASGSLVDVVAGQVSLWEVHSALDVVIFLDILLDFGLFLIAAFSIAWPKPPIFATHLQRKLDKLMNTPNRAHSQASREPSEISMWTPKSPISPVKGREDDLLSENSIISGSEDTKSLSFVLKQSLSLDCCLMIACHESTISESKSKNFAATLRAALLIFPPAHVFVCDNGASMTPVDDTEYVTRQVHADINYVYIPEGNKTFAFYWVNRHWIPFLEKAEQVALFRYAVMIDDDVPLPPDLHIPHEHLRQHPEIKAVHFPITATSPDRRPGLLVKCQDVEYKLAGLHKQLQSKMSRCLSCHGAIALWERDAMDKVFFEHDTVFHGEDMYMGLCLLRQRDDSRIISSPQTVVPTYAPESWGVLFRQRVKSWELTSHRKTLTYLKEFLSPRSFCHVPSLVLKPYFLQELLAITLDWLRVYLFCGLLLRDWLGLLIMTAFFVSLMYLQVVLFSFLVLRSRKDLRPSLGTAIAFPIYRLAGLVFRICALCHNLLVYSFDRGGVKIGRREDEIKDIPPVPPSPHVDWFTVWTPTKHTTPRIIV